MLPLGLLTAAQGHPMLVELKTGETLNGHLVSCDTYMNIMLKEVVQTSPDGDKFFRLPECYVRGNNIKYLRVPDEVVDVVKDQQAAQQSQRGGRGGGEGVGEVAEEHGDTQRRMDACMPRPNVSKSARRPMPAQPSVTNARTDRELMPRDWIWLRSAGGLWQNIQRGQTESTHLAQKYTHTFEM
ncbi:unnamed protein product [Zymoseptoria tritici ST99CH_3D7]|uniref:LSM complex subunit LSM4 n=1 Tax=Zymoseptoria tritici (strain ST99CH_3D7) TaxID=1276538 RepID=A0A1X7S5L6_ZYMT9|nr:unnamed protein product [Zymoseptoria tritici ST99CH_3D7]